MGENKCGTCTMCCKLLGILEISKPKGEWCPMCEKGKGCKAYEVRPPSCAGYQCMWLSSQSSDRPLDGRFRPDVTKVVITEQNNKVHVHCDPGYPSAWKTGEMGAFLERIDEAGIIVIVDTGHPTKKWMLRRLKRDTVARIPVTMTEMDEQGVQTLLHEGH